MNTSQSAVAFVLQNEGSALTNNVADRGRLTHWGITLTFFQVSCGSTKTAQDLIAMTLADAQDFYLKYVWVPLGLSDDDNLGVAAALFDAAVLCGRAHAVRTLQTCVGEAVDGKMGPKTLAAMRQANPSTLRVAFAGAQVSYFYNIAARDATQQRFLYGWLCRAVRPLSTFV